LQNLTVKIPGLCLHSTQRGCRNLWQKAPKNTVVIGRFFVGSLRQIPDLHWTGLTSPSKQVQGRNHSRSRYNCPMTVLEGQTPCNLCGVLNSAQKNGYGQSPGVEWWFTLLSPETKTNAATYSSRCVFFCKQLAMTKNVFLVAVRGTFSCT
jgi:hypothetical protein